MELQKIFDKKNIRLNVDAGNKNAVIKAIAALSKKNSKLTKFSEKEIFKALLEREDLSSTGLSNGVAIPHCTLKNLSDFVIGLLTLPESINFDSHDGEKSNLFIFIIAPQSKRNEHIKLLSNVAKIIKSPENRNFILKSDDKGEVQDLFINYFDTFYNVKLEPQEEKCLIQVIIQKEKRFLEILEIVQEIESSQISIIESNDIGKYLYSMPLFASFWNENDKGFNRIILSIIPKKIANKTLRIINDKIEEFEDKSGVMVLMQSLDYCFGSLNI